MPLSAVTLANMSKQPTEKFITSVRLAGPVNICIENGQQVAVCGPNGAGKTLLVNILLRQYPLLDKRETEYGQGIRGGDIRHITFRDSYGSADSTYFYQQRWNMTEMGESPVVGDSFPYVSDSEWKERNVVCR